MKNILLLIHDDAGQEARYQVALDVARVVNGHLICVDVTVIPQYAGDYVGGPGILLAEEQANETNNKTRMLARLAREDVSFEWIDRTGFITQTLQDHAGLADLIVLSSDAEGMLFPHMADVIGEALVRIGKPVIVVPPDACALNLHGRSMVAWDGSDNAEAALQAAVPLLAPAKVVTLYYVDDGSIGEAAAEAACYLSRHGIRPVIKTEPAGLDRPGVAILTETKLGHHDFVVMGAYSRARTIEALFGGATQAMIKRSPVPVLLAHRR